MTTMREDVSGRRAGAAETGTPDAAQVRAVESGEWSRPKRGAGVALVTGAGSGLGAATTRILVGAGYRVVAADIDLPAAERVAASLADGPIEPSFAPAAAGGSAATEGGRAAGTSGDSGNSGGSAGRAIACELDVSDLESAREAVTLAVGRFGSLDVLVNNAGVDVTRPFSEMGAAEWNRVLDVNLRGPMLMSQVALPALRASGSGHIVNIASTAAKRAWPNASAYHASKWGLLGFSHALHAELRSEGVKVTAIVTGGMRTPFLLDRFPELDPGLLQDPENVARTVLFALRQPAETVIPELVVLPMRETSWP
jgi:NAD(P)-dependent dehydrogenase (short-subunit alcohol dehydrogenase family)